MSTSKLPSLGEQVRAALEPIAGVSDESLRAALAERAASPRRRSTVRRSAPLGLALASAAAVVVWVALRHSHPGAPPLTFTVGSPGRPGTVEEWVSAGVRAGTSLRFSEGSRVLLDPGARARIVRLGASGAEIELGSGGAHVDIVPGTGGRWQVSSGPFVIRVKGTRFAVAWDAARDELELELYEGRVEVLGCSFGEGRAVVAGQRARASCKSGRASVEPLESAALPEVERVAPATEPTARPAEPAPVAERAERSARVETPTPAPSEPDWLSLARAGHYEKAHARAVALGFERELASGSAEEVLLLGDAARLSGNPANARSAYGAVRRRFPGGSAAANAAFQLGRLDAQAGQGGPAARWFETYLSEASEGPLAMAARGRLLELAVAAGDTERVRVAARRYLERHPKGPHAEQATRLLSRASPSSE